MPGDRPALIPINPGPRPPAGAAAPKKTAASTALYWANYYRKHDESPRDLADKVAVLNGNKPQPKFADVQAILVAYLTYRSKNAQPWMYAALGLAIEENKGKPEETRLMFKYASDAARSTQDPNHLVSVADLLLLQKQYDLAGPLIDLAMDKVPHRMEPMLMSMRQAEETKDARRMTEAAEKLLALGWPNDDEAIRAGTRGRVEQLAKAIREEGRGGEADAMLAKLPDFEARDLFVRLTWTGDADFDLFVNEPLGATASYQAPRTVFGGSIVKNGYGKQPEEIYVCPRGFDGDYSIRIETIYNNPDKPATHATLEVITHEGTAQESKRVHTISLSPGGKGPEPVVVTLKGGRRKVVLPLINPPGLYVVKENEKANAKAKAKPKADPAPPAAGKDQKAAVRPGPAPRDATPKTGAERR